MKRLVWIILALALLAGCARPAQPAGTTGAATAVPTTAATETTAPEAAGRYEPDSAIETQTDGAVRRYRVDEQEGSLEGLLAMGDGLLLFFGSGETTTLVRSGGETLVDGPSVTLTAALYYGDASVQVNDRGVGYFDAAANAVVLLDPDLREHTRVTLPETTTDGTMALTNDWKSAYYSAGNEIRCLDVETGISRLMRRETAVDWQYVRQTCFDGTVLLRTVSYGDGNSMAEFLSAQTGEILGTGGNLGTFADDGSRYFAVLSDGWASQRLVGEKDGKPQLLCAGEQDGIWYPVGGSVIRETSEDNATVLDLFDLESGRRTSSVTLEGVGSVGGVLTDETGAVWFLGTDTAREWHADLYRWDPDRTLTGETESHFSRYYTHDDPPDDDGLTECREAARKLEDRYGLTVCMGQLAEDMAPWDYTFEAEYQPDAIMAQLGAMEQALEAYPDGFLQQVKDRSGGNLSVVLLRGIYGKDGNTVPSADGLQYWSGGPCIALAATPTMDQNLYHEMEHVLDTCILSATPALDDWNSLNPADFSYDLNYASYNETDHVNSPYLNGDERAFIDSYSMTYPHEDRARIMEYAMMPFNDGLFASETMQQKLACLCRAIRETFELPEGAAPVWEQYLQSSQSGD